MILDDSGCSKVDMMNEVSSKVDVSFKETKTIPTYRPSETMI